MGGIGFLRAVTGSGKTNGEMFVSFQKQTEEVGQKSKKLKSLTWGHDLAFSKGEP